MRDCDGVSYFKLFACLVFILFVLVTMVPLINADDPKLGV